MNISIKNFFWGFMVGIFLFANETPLAEAYSVRQSEMGVSMENSEAYIISTGCAGSAVNTTVMGQEIVVKV